MKEGIPYTVVDIDKEEEDEVIKVWAEMKELVIINYCNPCKRSELHRGIRGTG